MWPALAHEAVPSREGVVAGDDSLLLTDDRSVDDDLPPPGSCTMEDWAGAETRKYVLEFVSPRAAAMKEELASPSCKRERDGRTLLLDVYGKGNSSGTT